MKGVVNFEATLYLFNYKQYKWYEIYWKTLWRIR